MKLIHRPIVIFVYCSIVTVNGISLWILSKLGWPVVFIGILGVSVMIVAYTVTACSDPGIIYECDYTPRNSHSKISNESKEIHSDHHDVEMGQLVGGGDQEPLTLRSPPTPSPSSNSRLVDVPAATLECGQCQLQRPHSAHHCNYCQVCIDKLDRKPLQPSRSIYP